MSLFAIIFFLALFVFILGIGALTLAGTWRVFTKAGRPGWACLIPFYNIYVKLEVAGKPGWWLIFYLIPLVNIVLAIITDVCLAKKFGESAGFGAGLFLLPYVFFPILGFGDAKYQGAGAPPVIA